jgi:hypothetical protein
METKAPGPEKKEEKSRQKAHCPNFFFDRSGCVGKETNNAGK